MKNVETKSKSQILDEVFEVLLSEGKMDTHYPKYEREEFHNKQMRDADFANEYWFRSEEAGDMKLFFNDYDGFRAYSQFRSHKGIEVENQVNKKLVELGYQR